MSDDIHYGSRPEDEIRYGDHISLKHNMTGRYLTSGENTYESGSGQQVVFAGGWNPILEATWIVIPPLESSKDSGENIYFGDVIRLKHVPSRCNLHSHEGFESPVTGQQEVTCFGNDYESDPNDHWRVEKWEYEEDDEGDDVWRVGNSFILRHVETGAKFHEESLDEDSNEVTGYQDEVDENDRWRVLFEEAE
ncbi:MIR motif-containing protein [Radiomyces spectabilis]|uniref:MIR motif-containing protein n=1 Tax=Radiomyces spectabilis TaxID=64574 RepID=UPI0022201351|nr:MIR motif-containing protein [Radiomyces spectabilis]KAI8377607.1 MIR motif-containing protein [Radiomyces spectabilis]